MTAQRTNARLPAPRRRLGRALPAATVVGVLLLGGCGEDAVSGGVAPEGQEGPPWASEPDVQRDAPNLREADDEIPPVNVPVEVDEQIAESRETTD